MDTDRDYNHYDTVVRKDGVKIKESFFLRGKHDIDDVRFEIFIECGKIAKRHFNPGKDWINELTRLEKDINEKVTEDNPSYPYYEYTISSEERKHVFTEKTFTCPECGTHELRAEMRCDKGDVTKLLSEDVEDFFISMDSTKWRNDKYETVLICKKCGKEFKGIRAALGLPELPECNF